MSQVFGNLEYTVRTSSDKLIFGRGTQLFVEKGEIIWNMLNIQ